VIDRGSFLLSRAFAKLAEKQGPGGDIVYVVSKNAIVAGPANVAYSAAKAAQLHQMRVLAAELAPLGVRVNAVNPDGVIQGSKIFAGEWGDNRARAYGVDRERLGEYYAQRTLLKREILPEDVASAVFALLSGLLAKTTGTVIPVDGGIAAAFLR
jgi:NAD(P)-dependent dehydrogenase (short-subunit alcohol dehydrogenase family)